MLRSRSIIDPVKMGTIAQIRNGNPTGLQRTHVIDSYVKSCEDDVVPGFSKKIKRGQYINNPCVIVESTETVDGSGSITSTSGGTKFISSGDGSISKFSLTAWAQGSPPVFFENTVDWPSIRSQMQLQALSRIDKTPYGFMEDLGEIGETVRFLRNPTQSLFNLSAAFKKRAYRDKIHKIKRWKKRADALSDLWLSYRFAASPLLRSIHDLMEALASKPQKLPAFRSARAYKKGTEREVKEWTFAPYVPATFFYQGEASMEWRASAYIHYRDSNPVNDWKFKYGLRLKDVPETMWALCPYSFMVDRALNISQMVRAITNLSDPTLTILGGGTTVVINREQSWWLQSVSQSGYTTTVVPDKVRNTLFEYRREPWTPTFVDVIPSLTPRGLVKDISSIVDLLTLTTKNLRLK